MGLSLYDIDYRLKMLEELNVDITTGEVLSDEEFNKLFDSVQMDLNSKIENTICFAKSLEAEAEAIKDTLKATLDEQNTEELIADIYKVRYTTVTSERVDTTAFKRACPELAKQFTKISVTRRFSIA